MSGDTEGRGTAPELHSDQLRERVSFNSQRQTAESASLTSQNISTGRSAYQESQTYILGIKCREPLTTHARSRGASEPSITNPKSVADQGGGSRNVEFVCGDVGGAESVVARTANGSRIELKSLSYDKRGLCREFIIDAPPLNLKVWFGSAVLLNIIAYVLHLHTWDSRIMISIVVFLFVALTVKLNFKVKRESLLVMTSIGVQVTTTFAFGRSKATFYDIARINDIIINEAITMHRVIYYLSLMIDGSGSHDHVCRLPIGSSQSNVDGRRVTSLVPLFTHSWPSLESLRRIYTGAKNTLQLNNSSHL